MLTAFLITATLLVQRPKEPMTWQWAMGNGLLAAQNCLPALTALFGLEMKIAMTLTFLPSLMRDHRS